ncbi:MAG: helix-turn-helix transcriptional regulator [Planctomycetota bacterium]
MVSDKTYLSVVEGIYDAAVDPSRWGDALNRLARPMSGGACLVMHDPLIAAGNVPFFSDWDAASIASYDAYYASRNAWLARVATRPVGKAEPGEFFLPRSDLQKTEWYNDFLRPNDIASGMGVTVMRDSNRFVSAAVLLPRCSDAAQASHVALLQRITPHIERALKVNRQLSAAEFRWSTAEECFHRLKVGIVVIGGDRKILFSNTEANRIFRQDDGLTINREGRLAAGTTADNQRLKGIFELIFGTTSPALQSESGVMSIQRRSGMRAYGLLITRLHPPTELFGGRGPMALLFVSDVTSQRPSIERLSEAFGLTASEGRLLYVLLDGHGLVESAVRLDISINTAKTHLKGLFEKMGCARQADLVRTTMAHPSWFAS